MPVEPNGFYGSETVNKILEYIFNETLKSIYLTAVCLFSKVLPAW